MEIQNNGRFKKGNKFGKGRPAGSKNKKTIVKESLERLNEVGITPLETTNEILNSLLKNDDISIDQKIKLLNVTTGLLKYELLTREQEVKYDELMTENELLEQENNKLKESFIGDTKDLLKHLQEQ